MEKQGEKDLGTKWYDTESRVPVGYSQSDAYETSKWKHQASDMMRSGLKTEDWDSPVSKWNLKTQSLRSHQGNTETQEEKRKPESWGPEEWPRKENQEECKQNP